MRRIIDLPNGLKLSFKEPDLFHAIKHDEAMKVSEVYVFGSAVRPVPAPEKNKGFLKKLFFGTYRTRPFPNDVDLMVITSSGQFPDKKIEPDTFNDSYSTYYVNGITELNGQSMTTNIHYRNHTQFSHELNSTDPNHTIVKNCFKEKIRIY